MKVLLVSAADAGGGAFIAARRLHQALLRNGIDSTLLVAKKTVDDESVIGPSGNVPHTWADIRHYLSLPLHRLHKTDNPSLHSFNVVPSALHKIINAMDVDVVNLHWVNREMMSIADIGKIRKPVVWTLHDMWPLLGTAHYPDFSDDLVKAPAIHGYVDLDEWMYARKARHWANLDITFVGPSQWMAANVEHSRLFASAAVTTIANPVDTQVYRLHDRAAAREMLGLDPQKRYILFGAFTGAGDIRKGFPYLHQALQHLSPGDHPDLELLVMGGGSGTSRMIEDIPFKVSLLGRLHDDVSLQMVYNAADVFVTPSLADNLPNTIVESLSCGTPVVAFAGIGGIADMVRHRENGYLAEPRNARDLAEGIAWALSCSNDAVFRQAVCARAVGQFAEAVVAAQYQKIYDAVLHRVTWR